MKTWCLIKISIIEVIKLVLSGLLLYCILWFYNENKIEIYNERRNYVKNFFVNENEKLVVFDSLSNKICKEAVFVNEDTHIDKLVEGCSIMYIDRKPVTYFDFQSFMKNESIQFVSLYKNDSSVALVKRYSLGEMDTSLVYTSIFFIHKTICND